MASQIKTSTIPTTHGSIFIRDTGNPTGPTILLLHGNSFSSNIFQHQLSSPRLTTRHRLLAMDLPGHGASSNATNPQATYTQPAYADAAIQVLQHLGIASVVVLGWSLGGHVAMEMVPRFAGVRGIVITGTPPVNAGEVAGAFRLANSAAAAGDQGLLKTAYAARDDLTEAEMADYARVCADPPFEPWMEEAVKRTDQRARGVMFRAFVNDQNLRQREIVETEARVKVAVINGKSEPFVDLAWIRKVKFANLWRGECVEMDGLLHAPFWARPEEYERLLVEFMEEL